MNTSIHSEIHTGSHYQYESEASSMQPLNIQSTEYTLPSLFVDEDFGLTFRQVLPSDINIFSELSKETLSISPINSFISELWNSIRRQSRQDITLSKLTDTKQEDGSVLLEWIFFNCRVSFQFDNDYYLYCLAFNDINTNKYSSLCESFKDNDFQKVSDIVVSFIYQHI